jgi:hypothetical protein
VNRNNSGGPVPVEQAEFKKFGWSSSSWTGRRIRFFDWKELVSQIFFFLKNCPNISKLSVSLHDFAYTNHSYKNVFLQVHTTVERAITKWVPQN